MTLINFSFNSKNNNQKKINEYNKKALLQVQNMVANQKRMVENQKRFMENQKNVVLNQKNVVLNETPKVPIKRPAPQPPLSSS